MSGKGNCFDNAPMESFKSELVHHTRFQSRAQARRELFEFIEIYYNRKRLYSALDYLSPQAFEERFYLT